MAARNAQTGFAHILIVLAIVAVAATGFTVYRVVGSSDGGDSAATTEGDQDSQIDGDQTSSQNENGVETINSSAESTSSTDDTGFSATTDPSDTAGSTGSVGSGSTEATDDNGNSSGGSAEGSPAEDSETTQTKSFTIDSFSFGYSTTTINVSPGDEVTINLTNSGGKHDWVVDELGAATSIINGGQTDSITFTVPQSAAGQTYSFYCSVGNHRALGMEGNLVVSS